MNCLNCHGKLPTGSTFCPHCGVKVSALDRVEPGPAAAAGQPAIRRSSWLIVAIGFLIMLAALCSARFLFFATEIRLGNTPGNMNNEGLAAEYDGWVYHAGSAYGLEDSSDLRKTRLEGSETVTLVKDVSPTYINVMDGWVYFISKWEPFKVRTDGSDLTAMFPSLDILDFTLAGNAVYGQGTLHPGRWTVSKMDFAKDRLSYLVIKPLKQAPTDITVSKDGWVYYTLGYKGPLRRIRINGKGDAEIIGGHVTKYLVIDRRIYYTCTDKPGIWTANTNGRGARKLTSDYLMTMNASRDMLFYSWEDEIWAIQIDKTTSRKIVNTGRLAMITEINVIGDWLYFREGLTTMYRVRMDGSGLQELP